MTRSRLPYIDYRIYNAAKVAYDMERNEICKKFAGGSHYALKKELGKIRFIAPRSDMDGAAFYLIGYFYYGSEFSKGIISLIYCVSDESGQEIAVGRYNPREKICYPSDVTPEEAERAGARVYTVMNVGVSDPLKRLSAIKKLIGISQDIK